jgi:long-chain acyl-CoA synthetase
LLAYAGEQVSHVKMPRSIEFVRQLPRHPNGKLYKRLLRDEYWKKA